MNGASVDEGKTCERDELRTPVKETACEMGKTCEEGQRADLLEPRAEGLRLRQHAVRQPELREQVHVLLQVVHGQLALLAALAQRHAGQRTLEGAGAGAQPLAQRE